MRNEDIVYKRFIWDYLNANYKMQTMNEIYAAAQKEFYDCDSPFLIQRIVFEMIDEGVIYQKYVKSLWSGNGYRYGIIFPKSKSPD